LWNRWKALGGECEMVQVIEQETPTVTKLHLVCFEIPSGDSEEKVSTVVYMLVTPSGKAGVITG
jgi:hypothetical protein